MGVVSLGQATLSGGRGPIALVRETNTPDLQSEDAPSGPQEASDLGLVRQVVAGEPEALGEVYDRYSQRVHAYCFRLTGSSAAAEDLTAITFLEAWRRRRDFRLVNESALPWLLGIAHNVARNDRRAGRRYQAALDRLGRDRQRSSIAAPDPAEGIVDRLAAEQQMAQVLDGLRRISSHEREVIELCIGAELTQLEAAKALNVPIGTVKSRLSRGLAKLRAGHTAGEALEDLR